MLALGRLQTCVPQWSEPSALIRDHSRMRVVLGFFRCVTRLLIAGNLQQVAVKRIAGLFHNETRQFIVRDVEVGGAGAFTINFHGEYALDVFPDDSLSAEHRRIFKPSAEGTHFVVTGAMAGDEPPISRKFSLAGNLSVIA